MQNLETYDIRIMVNDTDGASTGWTTYSDVITVFMNYEWTYDTNGDVGQLYF